MTDEEFRLALESNTGSKSRDRSKSPYSKTEMSRLADLKRQRGVFKGRLTLFDKYISQLDQSCLDSNLKTELNMRIQSTSAIYQSFNDIQCEIENIVDEQDLLRNFEYREQFENQYYSLLSTAKCILNVDEQTRLHSVVHPELVKLPKVKLPEFNGSQDWLEFRNSYVAMIHKRQDLDSIQKFHYLKSALSGSALEVIGALDFTATNYIHAWELLENRFHNHRLLVQNHVRSLFCAQSIDKACPAQIRKLIDTVLRNLRALKSLDEPTDSWDTLIIYLVVSKLDSATEEKWEEYKGAFISDPQNKSKTLKLNDLITVLKNRADMLEMRNSSGSKSNLCSKSNNRAKQPNPSSFKKEFNSNTHNTHTFISTNNKNMSSHNSKNKVIRTCLLCSDKHPLYACSKFINSSVQERWKLITNNKLCPNCMRSNTHALNDCVFGSCKLCHKKHNTLLHTDTNSNPSCNNSSTNYIQPQSSLAALHSVNNTSADTHIRELERNARNALALNTPMLQHVLLSTALIEVIDSQNTYQTVRALLDNGSQNCFITENLCKRLNIRPLQSTIRISGVGQIVSQSTHQCKIHIRSKINDFNTDLQCLVLPMITSKLPSAGVTVDSLHIPSHIQLADPTFNIPSEIDILLGAEIFWDLLNEEKIRLRSGPYLHNSKVGWIISGSILNNRIHANEQVQCNFVQLDSQLRKFWELEQISEPPHAMSSEERICETLFSETTERDDNGRFSVRIPLKESPTDCLGDSYTMARNRFLSLERKFKRLPQYKKLYCDFMREYEDLGHMTPVLDDIRNINQPYYILPHHGVHREGSTTTKLRVVFDASATTTSNKSLNDIQHVGPSLQNDIFSILLRFRQYKYVACADIEKMYRQILIQFDQRNLQLILWRSNCDKPIQLYRLNTVTYGTSSAPYLSMRCLRQLAQECNNNVISRVINEDFYVDDLITGHDRLVSLLDICSKTSQILHSGCFPLRKWTFNFNVTTDSTKDLSIGEYCQSKTLGIGWSNKSDELHFTTTLQNGESTITKRLMMSVISQIYDPLGLLAPVVITAKILLQKLWLIKIDWDDEVPAEVVSLWYSFIRDLQCLHEIRIPRCIVVNDARYKELHIFTDTSQFAFGACAYVRSYDSVDTPPILCRLLCAKSKLAPIKTISIPRLELCGALMGAKLYNRIKNTLRLEFDRVYFWTDSTIVQGWLRMSPHLLKTFVQNRVTQINDLTGDTIWRHVRGKENPADLLSRGVNLDSLKYDSHSLWWGGPAFLRESNVAWQSDHDESSQTCVELPEVKTVSLLITNTNELFNFDRFSSFNRLQRSGAYLLRFIHNTRNPNDHRTGSLSVDELHSSVLLLSRITQQESFPNEYHNLKSNLPVKIKGNTRINKISGLNIFMDEFNVIRIGGRLRNAIEFNYDKKHPVLLSSKHRLALLLCKHEHIRLLHAGPQLLVSTMRDMWWVLGARNLAKHVVHKCVICTRMKGQTLTPLMGELPSERLEPGFPYRRCGVDYTGPMFVLNRSGRGSKLIKCYICLFVCFTTRAVHLELVGSLDTRDYLLALKRFISRRGKPVEIFSDNGKNFVGAEKEMSTIFSNSQDVLNFSASNGIRFKFIPPYAPNFGGLWEAGVKSCKYHLRRVLQNAKLTYEEFYTVLTQIEAVLNSRPLSPLSTDPNDFLPLTPAHFLIGRPLTAPACKNLTEASPARLGRYERVEQLRQHFWERWSKEYVSELQRRTKWQADKDDLVENSLVLIKEDNLPPLKWKMGRIIRIIPGKDGVSRVADIRTATRIIRRACSKICPLPVQTDNTSAADSL